MNMSFFKGFAAAAIMIGAVTLLSSVAAPVAAVALVKGAFMIVPAGVLFGVAHYGESEELQKSKNKGSLKNANRASVRNAYDSQNARDISRKAQDVYKILSKIKRNLTENLSCKEVSNVQDQIANFEDQHRDVIKNHPDLQDEIKEVKKRLSEYKKDDHTREGVDASGQQPQHQDQYDSSSSSDSHTTNEASDRQKQSSAVAKEQTSPLTSQSIINQNKLIKHQDIFGQLPDQNSPEAKYLNSIIRSAS